MRVLPAALALLAAAALAVSAPAAPEENPFVLTVNPFQKGLEGWARTGSEKAFTWDGSESTLSFKGQSGKEPNRIVFSRISWETFRATMQVKSGTRKVSVVLQPRPSGDPVLLEIPRNAVRSGKWGEVVLSVGGGKAQLLVPEDKAEKAIASTDVPAGGRFGVGFEAPSGADGAVSGVKLVQIYENVPQVCEEGFRSVFNGEDLDGWRPMTPEMASVFFVEKGLLAAQSRTEGGGILVLDGGPEEEWELRMRALWTTTGLIVRAVQVPGHDGQINKFDSIQVILTDFLDSENMNDIVIRRAGGRCVFTVNGKKVVDEPVKEGAPGSPPMLIVEHGKRFHLRDIRIRSGE